MPLDNKLTTLSKITTEDLKDPSLIRLNAALQYLQSEVEALRGKGGTTGLRPYTPTVTALSAMTVTATSGTATWQPETGKVFITLDQSFTLGGSVSNQIFVTLPTTPPVSSVLSALSCVFRNPTTPLAGVAFLQNGKIICEKYDATFFATGACEIVVTGWYIA